MADVNRIAALSISLGSDLAAVAERLRRVTVLVRAGNQGNGSGVIWRADGLIVTNAHVASALHHAVELDDGRVFAAQLLARDVTCDLAALKIAPAGFEPAVVRDASTLRTGEVVVAVGNPMGVTGAFAAGLVSATPRPDDVLLRANIRLAPGNSGGPLADARGQVVGINSMVVDGFGIAVTSGAVERFLAGLQGVRARRAFVEVA